MKTVFEHIEHIKGKPHHIRKQVAFTAAGAGAALVAMVWLVGNVYLGTFALHGSSFADAAQQSSSPVVKTSVSGTGLAGAAAALENPNAPAQIEIVDTASSTRPAKKPEPTTIPF